MNAPPGATTKAREETKERKSDSWDTGVLLRGSYARWLQFVRQNTRDERAAEGEEERSSGYSGALS